MSGRKGRSTHVEFRLDAEARSQGPASADGKTNPPSSSSNSRVGGTTNNTSAASTNSHASKRNASPLGEAGHSHVPTEYVVYALPDTDGVASISDELYAALAAVEEEKRRAAEESAAAAALNEAEHDAAKRGGRRGRSKSASGRRGSRRGSKRSGSISKGRRASRSKSRSRSRSSSVSSKGSSRARRSRSTSASSARSSTKRSRSSSRGSSGGKRASSKQGKRRTSPSKKKPTSNKNNKKMMAKPATRKKRSPSKSPKRGTSPNKNRRGRKTSRSSSRSSTRSKSSGKSSSRGSSASRRSNSTKAPTRTPSPSDRRKKAAAAPKKAATPSRMGGGGSRPSSQRGGARRASPKGRRGPSDGVTEKCLKSINYTSFAPSAKGGAKNKRQKMMSEFVAAYQRGIAIYDREYSAGMDDILKQYRVESVDPQARELLRLVKYITYLRDNCQQKLDLAQHLANTVLTGVEQLLQQAHESGLSLCEESNIISFQAPFVDGDANTAMGHPMPEVLGADEQLTENHPAQRFVPEQEVCKINGIRDFFNQSLEAIRCKEVVLPLPSAAPDVEDMVAACADEAAAEQTYVEERSQEADVVKVKLGDLSDAVANLLERVKHQDQEYRRKVEAQQRAMDEGATRQKVADDVLVGTRQQQCIIANDSIERLRQLSEELRTRMDQVELEVRSSVQEVIHNSAELCLDNKEYYDHVLQEERKMDCKRMCINKLERSVVEQAGLLREVQDEIMDLWRSHRAAHAGRSEKSTEVHRSLPTPYDAMLRQCDRDTLLRLLHHISLMNDGATGRLMGALDEHAHFLAGNSAEAVAVKERTAKIEAVAALLDKVQEEGGIHRNPHAITKSLSETVMHMVEQYSRLMSFDEKHTRAVIRREEARQRVDPPAFFSDLTPVPPRMANKAADHQPMRCPYSELLYPPIDPEEGRRASARATNSQQHGHSSMSTAMAMSKEVMHHALPPLKHTQAPPPEVVSALRRSNPSTQHTTCSTISVVGDGRWGGMAAVPRRDGVSTREMFADNTPSFITQPTLPRRTGRQRTALTEAMEAEAQRKAAQPSPSLPERLGLVNHVLGTYNHSFEELADGTVCVEAPDKIKKAYMDDDMKYIDQQRALHQRMFDDSHLDVDLD